MAIPLHSNIEAFSFSALPRGRDAPPLPYTGLAVSGSFKILREACDRLGRANSCPHTQVQPLIQPVGLLCPRVSVLLLAGRAGRVEAGTIALH